MRLGILRIEGVTSLRSIEVDFASLGPGVHAITGPNGGGKTTILECSGPGILYGELPSRPTPGIQNWVGEKGGSISLTFSASGHDYAASLQIERMGKTASLTRDGKKLVTGKVRDYDAAIEKLFGPARAFYTSVFGVQGGGGRFGSLPVTDRKGVFRYYLDLDSIAATHEVVRARLKAIDASLADSIKEDMAALAREIADLESRHAETMIRRDAAREKLDRARERAAILRDMAALAGLKEAVEKATDELLDLEDGLADSPRPKGPDPKSLARAAAEAKRARDVEGRLSLARVEAERTRGSFERLIAEAARCERSAKLLKEVPCREESGKFAATCKLLDDARSAENELADLHGRIADANRMHTETQGKAKTLEREARDLVGADERLSALNDRVRAVEEWERLCARVEAARQRARDLHARLPADLPDDLPAKADCDDAERLVHAAGDESDRLVREAGVVHGQIMTKGRSRAQLGKDLKDAERAIAARRPLLLLEQALGPGGVQAMEIAAAGPSIASLANTLLDACYGTRFEVEVRTLRELKGGGVAEDFSIVVHDNLRGVTNTIEGLSKGEGVIVDEALRMALALFSVRRSGIKCETLWRDETVGDLDANNAAAYVAILHKAREMGGFHQVLYVTHDERQVEAADGVVEVREGGDIEVRRLR